VHVWFGLYDSNLLVEEVRADELSQDVGFYLAVEEAVDYHIIGFNFQLDQLMGYIE